MKGFKEILSMAHVSKLEHQEFVQICSDWGYFCSKISQFDKVKVLKLMKYLVDERPKSRRLLARTIGRFNRLNALKKEDLL